MLAWNPDDFKSQIMALEKNYHIHHPYNKLLNSGAMSREQVQLWVANRFYYQINIPIKDAAVMANCDNQAVRREWIHRILDHDGYGEDKGGIEAWLKLGVACGLTIEEMMDLKKVLPAVRFAVDAYVNFARQHSWQEGVCASLTELFAPKIHQERLANWPKFYPWIEQEGLLYFRKRLQEAPRDVEFALAQTLQNFTTRTEQDKALQIIKFKLDVLWSISDALYLSFLLDQQRKPKITGGYRLQVEKEGTVLLYPEGMVKLNDSGVSILQECNGLQTVEEIVASLQKKYPGADLKADVHSFMETAHGKGWIQYTQ